MFMLNSCSEDEENDFGIFLLTGFNMSGWQRAEDSCSLLSTDSNKPTNIYISDRNLFWTYYAIINDKDKFKKHFAPCANKTL